MGTRARLSSSASSCSSSSSYYGCWRGVLSGSRSSRRSSSTNLSVSKQPGKRLTLFDDVKFILSRQDEKLSRLEDDLNFMVGWLNNKFGFMLRHGSTSSIASACEGGVKKRTLPADVMVPDQDEPLGEELERHSSVESLLMEEDLGSEKDSKIALDQREEHIIMHEDRDNDNIDNDDYSDDGDDDDDDAIIEDEDYISSAIQDVQQQEFVGKPEHEHIIPIIPFKTDEKRVRSRKPRNSSTIPNNEGQLPSQCDICGKFLKDPSSLRQHKQIHLNIRPFICPEPGCGKSFRRKFHMQTHLLIHTGERTHQCGYCGRLFLLQKDLVSHERIHTGVRPFQCPDCPKSFNLKSHLVMHQRTHTGEKPYKCDICFKCFSQSNSLRLHRKKLHSEEQSSSVATGRIKERKKKTTSQVTKSKANKTQQEVAKKILESQAEGLPTTAKLPISRNQGILTSTHFTCTAPTTLAFLQPMTSTNNPIQLYEHGDTTKEHIIFPQSPVNIISSTLPLITTSEILNIPHANIPITRI